MRRVFLSCVTLQYVMFQPLLAKPVQEPDARARACSCEWASPKQLSDSSCFGGGFCALARARLLARFERKSDYFTFSPWALFSLLSYTGEEGAASRG